MGHLSGMRKFFTLATQVRTPLMGGTIRDSDSMCGNTYLDRMRIRVRFILVGQLEPSLPTCATSIRFSGSARTRIQKQCLKMHEMPAPACGVCGATGTHRPE